jgi:hypothetical protein
MGQPCDFQVRGAPRDGENGLLMEHTVHDHPQGGEGRMNGSEDDQGSDDETALLRDILITDSNYEEYDSDVDFE